MEKASVCCLITDGEKQMTQIYIYIYILSIFTTFTKLLFSFLFFSFPIECSISFNIFYKIFNFNSVYFYDALLSLLFYIWLNLVSEPNKFFTRFVSRCTPNFSHTHSLTLSLKTPRNQQSLVLACFCLCHNLSFLSYTTQHFRRRGTLRKTKI